MVHHLQYLKTVASLYQALGVEEEDVEVSDPPLVIFQSKMLIRGGGDPKFSKMVALQGPQNRKMVALQRSKFGQKCLFLNIFGVATDFEL